VINSRNLDDLAPPVKQRAQAFVEAAKAKGIDGDKVLTEFRAELKRVGDGK
jgi:hypothetical protein